MLRISFKLEYEMGRVSAGLVCVEREYWHTRGGRYGVCGDDDSYVVRMVYRTQQVCE